MSAPTNDFDLAEERRIYYEGIRLFNEGCFFEAHDLWEEVWRQTPDRRRERFYRGIIQGAVTLELLRSGRAVGVRQVYVSCSELLEELPPVFMGLDIPGFLERLRHAIAPAIDDLQTRQVTIDPSRLFQIELQYDPFRESRYGENAATDTAT
jgi:predicted metal-dependent hydrolase